MTRGALDGRDLTLEIAGEGARPARQIVLPLSRIEAKDADAQMFRKIGIVAPLTRPEIGEVMAGGAAERAGLRRGDVVRSVGATAIVDGQQLRERDPRLGRRAASRARRPGEIERGGQALQLEVTPEVRDEGAIKVGRIGAYVGAPPEMVTVRQGVVDGAVARRGPHLGGLGAHRAHDGQDADRRGLAQEPQRPADDRRLRRQVRQHGLHAVPGVPRPHQREPRRAEPLPLPVLDGGHLMYYLWEGLTGKSVSDAWMERFQRGGVALLLVMMSIALFNDVTRLFG